MSETSLTNNTGLSLGMALWLASDSYDYNDDPKTISTTTLLKTPKQIILARRVPKSMQVQDVWEKSDSALGSAAHTAIENTWLDPAKREAALNTLGIPQSVQKRIVVNPEGDLPKGALPVYMENRLTKVVNGWTVTGKYDLIIEGEVQDYKFLKTFAYSKGLTIDKFKMQGSIYRYLDPVKITQDSLTVNMFFKDWSRGQLALAQQTKKPYPPYPVLSQRIPLLSMNEIDRYCKTKLKELDTLMDAPEEDIPMCSDEDIWRTPSVFKYYKNPAKTTRSTANFPTLSDAQVRYREDGMVGIVKEVKGEVKGCTFCAAFPVCKQGQSYFSG